MNIKTVIFALSLLPSAALAWPWDPQSFEECVAKEMKGRPSNQTGLVIDSCRKQFPALPSFTKTGHVGVLHCYSSTLSTNFELRLEPKQIQAGQCLYSVGFRDEELIKASTKGACLIETWTAGTDVGINFHHGLGTFSDSRDYRQQIGFECREKR